MKIDDELLIGAAEVLGDRLCESGLKVHECDCRATAKEMLRPAQAKMNRLRAENVELRRELNTVADSIMHIDGDRDHMAQSNMTCEQTQRVARYLRRLAAKEGK